MSWVHAVRLMQHDQKDVATKDRVTDLELNYDQFQELLDELAQKQPLPQPHQTPDSMPYVHLFGIRISWSHPDPLVE